MPKKIDIAVQRRAIASAAITAITESGLEGARLRDVARAADVTTGAVMHYFDGKDAVLEAALEEIVRRTLERMETPLRPGAVQNVPSFIGRVGRYLPTDEEGRAEWRVWLAFWARAIADPRLAAIHRRHYRDFADRLVPNLMRLAEGHRQPGEDEVRRCADAVTAALDGISVRATLEPDLWPARRQKETLGALLRPLLDDFLRPAPAADRDEKDRPE